MILSVSAGVRHRMEVYWVRYKTNR